MAKRATAKNEKKSSIQIEDIDIGLLDRFSFGNPKKTTDDARKRLAKSIEELGFVDPLLVRPRGDRFELIDGHHRYDAMVELGRAAAPCVVVDVDDDKAKMLLLAMRQITDWDLDALNDFVGSLLEDQASMSSDILALTELNGQMIPVLADAGTEFLNQFDTSDADQTENPVPISQPQAGGLVQLTISMTPAQDQIVRESIRKAKEAGAAKTAEALTLVCASFLKASEG